MGAELIDLGADSDTASSVEEFFDKINIFEDTAEDRTKRIEAIRAKVLVFTAGGVP